MQQQFKIDHVGWVTKDIEKFEKFWCGILSYKETYCNKSVNQDMMRTLFGTNTGGIIIKRYIDQNGLGPEIEIHFFPHETEDNSKKFNQAGINHICLRINESRESWMVRVLPKEIKRIVYSNPGGWQNIFIQDYEENWIELKENL